MSSSSAMNRRISRNAPGAVRQQQNMQPPRKQLSGTPLQQHYQILTFHEKRIKSMEQALNELALQVERLTIENNNLRKHMEDTKVENDSGTVQLNINDA